MSYVVVCFNAAGTRREHRCWARNESAACKRATVDLYRLTSDASWRASAVLPA